VVLVSPPLKTAHHEPGFLSAIMISSVRGCPLSMFCERPNCPWGCHLLRCAVQQCLLAAANGKHTQHSATHTETSAHAIPTDTEYGVPSSDCWSSLSPAEWRPSGGRSAGGPGPRCRGWGEAESSGRNGLFTRLTWDTSPTP